MWRQDARIDASGLRWSLGLRSQDGEVRLAMRAAPEEVVCLGYRNPPRGRVSHCLNSKLAGCTLRVNPANDEGFVCKSAHGAALEILTNEPDPRFEVV